MQNKIDRLILNGNNEFSEMRNVIAALIEYSRCLDLFDLLDRSYNIQIHELLVRIAICYDILGNFSKTIEYLNKALSIVPNVASLILYKSVLLQTLGRTDDAQKILVKYKQISDKKKMDLYETFRLVFYYSTQLEKEVLLREINDYFDKYPKNAVVLYLRAMIYLELSNASNHNNLNVTQNNNITNSAHKKPHNGNDEYYMKYETDIKESLQIEPHDTEFLIRDGITNENLTKLFFMILPDMDFYQPKPLANYKTFLTGLKVVYVIIKAVKMFKIKVEKKKLKVFYSNKLKLYKKRLENSKSACDNSDNSNNYSNNSIINPQNQSEIRDTTNDRISLNEASNSGTGTGTNTQNKSVLTNNTSDLAENNNTNNRENKDGSDKDSSSLKYNINNNINNKNNRESKSNSGHGYNLHSNSNNSNCNINSNNINSKSPTIIKNNVSNVDDLSSEIKKEYELKVKSLYKSAWLYNLRQCDLSQYNIQCDIDTNYFIKNKYYAPFNLKESILTGIKQNIEYRSNKNIETMSNDRVSLSPDTLRNQNNNNNFANYETRNGKNKFLTSSKNYKSYNTTITSNQNTNNIKPIVSTNNIGNYFTKQTEEVIANFSISEINHRPYHNAQDADSMSFSSDINLLDANSKKKNDLRDELLRSNNMINNLKKLEKDKLKLQKVTAEVIKNEVQNKKKYIYKPSPRMDVFKTNPSLNKFTSFSKEKKNDKDYFSSDKYRPNPLGQNNAVGNNSNSNNTNINLTSNSVNKFEVDNKNNIYSNIEIGKNNYGQISLRKSLDFNKAKVADDIIKKGLPGNNVKPILFKKLTKNINNKLSNIISAKIKRSDSATSGGSNLKTNENI